VPKEARPHLLRVGSRRPMERTVIDWLAQVGPILVTGLIKTAGRGIEKGFGKTPVFNREGGSIPVVATSPA
jgi:hypothetical protein